MTEDKAAESIDSVDSTANEYPKTSLVIVGVLQIILGGLSVLVAPLMLIGMLAARANPNAPGPEMSLVMMIPGMLLYLGVGAWLIWMGIGSIKARRWARALILVSAWLGLMTGIGGVIFMSIMMPDMMTNQMAGKQDVTPAMASVARWAMVGFMTLVGIIIPGSLVLFYSRKKVRDTFEHRDPRTVWTDKCPLPVLLLSGLSLGGAVSMLNLGFNNWIFPFFGTIIDGAAGATVAIATMLVFCYAARGIYRLEIKAWRLVVALTVVGLLSIVITFSQLSLVDFFVAASVDMPAQSAGPFLDAVSKNELSMKAAFAVQTLIYIGFLLYTKRFFTSR